MKDSLISAIASVLGMFITGGFGYLTSKNKPISNTSIDTSTNRHSLSDDERQFRIELKDMMLTYQNQVKELTLEVARLTKANLQLEVQVRQLTARNESLETQVHELTTANRELKEEVQRRRNSIEE
ncbi:hypothetical protein ABEX53_10815 [Bacillus toyonensis]|uniref:hypothetical protein n=1 Tax=Bacillus toyonensis TaxID=155322 RepID=UPI000CD93665|nr:hypothetical protein [Bacillus toyonensis]MED3541361.1 hypothetical protein [Bacillus toyonensis]QQN86318.1 hypothetical protein I0K03_28015 [Bacillus toyonensis]